MSIITFLLFTLGQVKAQTISTVAVDLAPIPSQHLEVTYQKTTTLIFAHPIYLVDLGSDLLVADFTKGTNLLRIKAAVRDFNEETNVTVVTADGSLYNFDVRYTNAPRLATLKVSTQAAQELIHQALLPELGESQPFQVRQAIDHILAEEAKTLATAKSYRMVFKLQGIYIYMGKFYIRYQLDNQSSIPYDIDFQQVFVSPKRKAKRKVTQRTELRPVYQHLSPLQIGPGEQVNDVIVLDRFPMAKGGKMSIHLLEKKGGRHLRISTSYRALMKAQTIHLE